MSEKTVLEENLQAQEWLEMFTRPPLLRHLHMILEKKSQAHKPAPDSVHSEALFWFNQQ